MNTGLAKWLVDMDRLAASAEHLMVLSVRASSLTRNADRCAASIPKSKDSNEKRGFYCSATRSTASYVMVLLAQGAEGRQCAVLTIVAADHRNREINYEPWDHHPVHQ